MMSPLSQYMEQEEEGLYQLDQAYFPHPWSRKSWQSVRGADPYWGLVYLKQQELCGFCLFHRVEGDQVAHLLKILVRPESRKFGLGSHLMMESIRDLKKQGLESIILEVHLNNIPAVNFYKKQGFEELHMKKNYYSDGGDALVMRGVI